MSDANLLVFGCAVSFIAVSGAYLIVRERFQSAESGERVEPLREAVPVAVVVPVSTRAAS